MYKTSTKNEAFIWYNYVKLLRSIATVNILLCENKRFLSVIPIVIRKITKVQFKIGRLKPFDETFEMNTKHDLELFTLGKYVAE